MTLGCSVSLYQSDVWDCNKHTPLGTSPPSDVKAVQDGLTSIRVSWTQSSNAIIYYDNNRGHSGRVTLDSGHTQTHTLTSLVNGDTYKISVVATSENPPSTAVELQVELCELEVFPPLSPLFTHIIVPPPGEVNVSVSSITASSISLSWSVASGSVQLGGGVERD